MLNETKKLADNYLTEKRFQVLFFDAVNLLEDYDKCNLLNEV